ncbi:glycosyltransferase family 20-domain-containing protein [Mycotypha africana]|uniref:glycosyltransferase family 20-domain-containing protein n=1 Tax=Mycotypha africana TaxID=64632 RepID=UPI0023017AEA|nr:glycosyltransferase family 20-domain-containing protein [Mycotypha africana]KAI8988048.1 glycosyltransferase family 20-domain-containing protein [Mycotypha africana]
MTQKKGRIINVTHQIPYEISFCQKSQQWQFAPRRGHGAMYDGVHSLRNEWNIIYIGWTGQLTISTSTSICHASSTTNVSTTANTTTTTTTTTDMNKNPPTAASITTNTAKELIDRDLTDTEKLELYSTLKEKYQCIPLFIDGESVAGHYDGYCKTMLWPLLHYMIWNDATDGRLERKQWEAYAAVNQIYADFVSDLYQDGDIIWVHDYHLLLVPSMVRAKHPKARIGLFVHSPFPTSEIFRCLPKRQEILKGMIGANLIGFQTYAYARHFISTCTRVLGYESSPEGVRCLDGHFCHVGTFPIGINPSEIEARCRDPTVQSKIKAIREMYAGKKILVGRDKIDLVKGALQKLAAFEKFLTDYPEWKDRVVMIQLTDGTNNDTWEHRKISETVAQINNKFGNLEFSPVYHFHHQIQVDEYYALLSTADVGVITANRDGMNTTSLEYVVCQQQGQQHGPLILSELTGTAGTLSSAMMINPWDYAGVAKAINEALCMSEEEKKSRHLQMLDYVETHTSSFWAKSFLNVLEESIAASEQSSYTPILDINDLLKDYNGSKKKRLLCFDYDGTLSAIRQIPGSRAPTPEMLNALQALCDDPQNVVWVISGRDEATLDKWLGQVKGLGLSAEHGCFLKYPGTHKWINLLEHIDMSWKHDIVEIFTYYAERTTSSFIEHKRCSVTWHYRLADPDYGAFQSKECQNHLENAILSKMPIEVLVGKKNLEVRPTATNKGEIIKRLLSGNDENIDFVMCCGDDKTDEDMFRVLKKITTTATTTTPVPVVYTVVVGIEDKKTMATWRLPTVQDVLETFNALTSHSNKH